MMNQPAEVTYVPAILANEDGTESRTSQIYHSVSGG